MIDFNLLNWMVLYFVVNHLLSAVFVYSTVSQVLSPIMCHVVFSLEQDPFGGVTYCLWTRPLDLLWPEYLDLLYHDVDHCYLFFCAGIELGALYTLAEAVPLS